MPPSRFEPAIQARELQQNQTADRSATAIGSVLLVRITDDDNENNNCNCNVKMSIVLINNLKLKETIGMGI